MATPLQKRVFIIAAAIAGVAEAGVIYTQWPSPPLKVCASAELGNLMAAASRTDMELREARSRLRPGLGEAETKSVMSLEAASATAWNDVATFKQRALEKQKAGGDAGGKQTCS